MHQVYLAKKLDVTLLSCSVYPLNGYQHLYTLKTISRAEAFYPPRPPAALYEKAYSNCFYASTSHCNKTNAMLPHLHNI